MTDPTRKQQKISKRKRRSHYIAGIRSVLELMPPSTNRYRRYKVKTKIGSFENDHLAFNSDQEKVGGDIRKAIDSLEQKRISQRNDSIH